MSKNLKNSSSASVLASWHSNAKAWTKAVRSNSIQSRALVTDQAIVDAIVNLKPKTVLDLGCGEGWLAYQLAERGMRVLGVDAVPALVQAAQELKSQQAHLPVEFRQLAYGEIDSLVNKFAFDLIVCNFSLLDKDDSTKALITLPQILSDKGHVLIQTLHPEQVATNDNMTEGWREESWQSIGDDFSGSAPWYYRSLPAWRKLFIDCALQVADEIVPIHPLTNEPASIIFALRAAN